MKKFRRYNLAHKYHESTHNLTCFNEKTDTQSTDKTFIAHKSQAIVNMFENNKETRIRKLDMMKEKDYGVLGMNEISVYSRVKQRRRRDMKSNPHDCCSYFSYGSSRTSNKGTINVSYLTKDQVIKQCSPPNLSAKLNQTEKQEFLLLSLKGGSHLESFQNSWTTSVRNQTSNEKRKKFSLAKLKIRMNQYKKSWEHHLPNKKYSENKMTILRRQAKISRLPSENYLSKLQRKRFKNDKANNQSFLPWNQTLRSNNQFHNKNKEIQTIEANGRITASGKSKLRKEKDWIEQKDGQGFFFSSRRGLKD